MDPRVGGKQKFGLDELTRWLRGIDEEYGALAGALYDAGFKNTAALRLITVEQLRELGASMAAANEVCDALREDRKAHDVPIHFAQRPTRSSARCW